MNTKQETTILTSGDGGTQLDAYETAGSSPPVRRTLAAPAMFSDRTYLIAFHAMPVAAHAAPLWAAPVQARYGMVHLSTARPEVLVSFPAGTRLNAIAGGRYRLFGWPCRCIARDSYLFPTVFIPDPTCGDQSEAGWDRERREQWWVDWLPAEGLRVSRRQLGALEWRGWRVYKDYHRGPETKPDGGWVNVEKENPALSDQWKKQRRYAERRFETRKGMSDEAYIAGVRAGTHPTVHVRVVREPKRAGDVPGPEVIEVPFDPVWEGYAGVNTREGRVDALNGAVMGDSTKAFAAAAGGSPFHYGDSGKFTSSRRFGRASDAAAAADAVLERATALGKTRPAYAEPVSDDDEPTADEILREQPIWQAQEFDTGGSWDAWTHEDWTAVTDGQLVAQVRVRCDLEAALRVRRDRRYTAIDHVLDDAEDQCGPDFAEQLVDEVRQRSPDYRQHCLDQVAGYHRRGRHPQAETRAAA